MKHYLIYILFIALIPLTPKTTSAQMLTIIGHRGAPSLAPENTISSFEEAYKAGADYIELDVHMSSDDSLMIIHDSRLNRTTEDTGDVRSLTYAMLRRADAGKKYNPRFTGEKIPTLYEVLSWAKDKIKVCVEIKGNTPGITEKTLEMIERLGMQEQVIVFCFDIKKIIRVRSLNNSIPILWLVDAITKAKIDEAKIRSFQAIGFNSGLDSSISAYARSKGITIWPWTKNNADTMHKYIRLGVDGIITNYPQVLRSILSEEPGITNLHISTGETGGTIQWEAPNESRISGYEIERKNDNNPQWHRTTRCYKCACTWVPYHAICDCKRVPRHAGWAVWRRWPKNRNHTISRTP